MKKTLWLEEIRRRVYAEKYGISADVDETSIAGTADAFYVISREKRNKYIKKTDIVGPVWTTNNPTHPKISGKTTRI